MPDWLIVYHNFIKVENRPEVTTVFTQKEYAPPFLAIHNRVEDHLCENPGEETGL
jgi:hypothetical protein